MLKSQWVCTLYFSKLQGIVIVPCWIRAVCLLRRKYVSVSLIKETISNVDISSVREIWLENVPVDVAKIVTADRFPVFRAKFHTIYASFSSKLVSNAKNIL